MGSSPSQADVRSCVQLSSRTHGASLTAMFFLSSRNTSTAGTLLSCPLCNISTVIATRGIQARQLVMCPAAAPFIGHRCKHGRHTLVPTPAQAACIQCPVAFRSHRFWKRDSHWSWSMRVVLQTQALLFCCDNCQQERTQVKEFLKVTLPTWF